MLFLQDLDLATLIGLMVGLVLGITCHEFTHALLADQLGDHGPRAMGRVSLNPLRHLDPLGTVLLVVAGMGWGRPVPVNPGALRSGRQGLALVAVGGPLANVVVALVLAGIFRGLVAAGLVDGGGAGQVVAGATFVALQLNLLLALLNLIPIPPLDGYSALMAFLPVRQQMVLQRWAGYGLLLLVLLLFLPGSPLHWYLGLARPWARALVGA